MGGRAPRILNFDTEWRWEIGFMVPTGQEAGLARETSLDMVVKMNMPLPARDWTQVIQSIESVILLGDMWDFKFSWQQIWYWDIAPCSLLVVDRSFTRVYSFHNRPDDGGSTLLMMMKCRLFFNFSRVCANSLQDIIVSSGGGRTKVNLQAS
jgi:hypothetical protein